MTNQYVDFVENHIRNINVNFINQSTNNKENVDSVDLDNPTVVFRGYKEQRVQLFVKRNGEYLLE